jgi:MFS superfamily sulfate permease-like transporter
MRLNAYFRNEIAAGAIASILSLPVCVAAGVLAFSPLGPAYAALGATAGLLGAIAAGGISALAATSSFVVTIPRVSESLVLVNLIVTLLAKPGNMLFDFLGSIPGLVSSISMLIASPPLRSVLTFNNRESFSIISIASTALWIKLTRTSCN